MKRTLFTLASALSLLLLLLATAVLWVRSYVVVDDLMLSPTVLLKSGDGTVSVITSTRRQIYVPDSREMDEFRSGASSHWKRLGMEYFRYGPLSYDPTEWTVVRVTYCLVALAAAALPVISGLRMWHHRTRPGTSARCKQCGYDLRATPDRCPECGMAVESVTASAASASHG